MKYYMSSCSFNYPILGRCSLNGQMSLTTFHSSQLSLDAAAECKYVLAAHTPRQGRPRDFEIRQVFTL